MTAPRFFAYMAGLLVALFFVVGCFGAAASFQRRDRVNRAGCALLLCALSLALAITLFREMVRS